ncbi:MAG: glycosyltransferase family 4 protein [Candidatus Marsarchaeota archaeon]|nr:glycosyltransferase family 4 protein [Candidatus Marsarchaeota archaeon]
MSKELVEENQKIRLLDITGTNPLEPGGVGSFVRNLNKELESNGFSITNICYTFLQDKTEQTDFGTLIALKVPKNEILRVLLYPLRVLSEVKKNKADIIIEEGPSTYGAGLLVDLFAKKNAIFIERAHGTHYGLIEYTPKKSIHMRILGKLLAGLIERYSFRRADYSVAVSKLAAMELKKYFGIDKRKIRVIYPGVAIDEFKPLNRLERHRLRGELHITNGMKHGIWVGLDPYRKGLDILLEVANALKDIKFSVIGITKEEAIKFMKEYKIEDNKCSNVNFLGKISEHMKIKYYQAADFLLFPSRHEGFAFVPFEAMAAGLPVIVSDMVGTNEIIKNGEQGFIIKSHNPYDYVKAIRRLNSIRYPCKQNIRVVGKYTWKQQSALYKTWFKQLQTDKHNQVGEQ